jgi:MHS family proline/betaine transporter-like MFS transporter
VIGASAAGTIIEWYDFYLYGVLAAFFSTQFFPKDNPTAALLASLATFGAGFAVRPFGAAVFGRIGDIIGRKFTFLVTITVMGVSTALVGISSLDQWRTALRWAERGPLAAGGRERVLEAASQAAMR